MTMLIFLLMTLSSIFIWLSHPISMGITIIIQTITISIITGLLLWSFWFSYIILISMLSGMLVLLALPKEVAIQVDRMKEFSKNFCGSLSILHTSLQKSTS